jgi:hypothetical protein
MAEITLELWWYVKTAGVGFVYLVLTLIGLAFVPVAYLAGVKIKMGDN